MSGERLRLGDCLDPATGLASLTDRGVDVVLTDPPYSQHVHASARRGSMSSAAFEKRPGRASFSRAMDLGFEHLTPEVLAAVAGEVGRICRRWALVFSDTESAHLWRAGLQDAGMEYVRTCFWHKVGGAPQFTGDRPAVALEAITCAHQPGRKVWNGGGRQGLYAFPIVLDRGDGEARVHTTQKPERLMEALVRDFTEPGDLVVDPFAGSGTTGVVSLRAGRRFLGWEIAPKYHAIATRRISCAREQTEMQLAVTP